MSEIASSCLVERLVTSETRQESSVKVWAERGRQHESVEQTRSTRTDLRQRRLVAMTDEQTSDAIEQRQLAVASVGRVVETHGDERTEERRSCR